jgi:hypothetical protein
MKDEIYKKLQVMLSDKAETFIMENDEDAEIIKDGQIKEGSDLLMRFVISLYEDGIIHNFTTTNHG